MQKQNPKTYKFIAIPPEKIEILFELLKYLLQQL